MIRKNLSKSISYKIYTVIAVLSAITIFVALLGSRAIDRGREKSRDLLQAHDVALRLERINTHLNGVIMDNRGIYGTSDPDQVKRFAESVVDYLNKLDEQTDALDRIIDQSERPAFSEIKRTLGLMTDYRKPMLIHALKGDSAAAKTHGDNATARQQIRDVRIVLQKSIIELAAVNKARSAAILAERDSDDQHQSRLLFIVASTGILIVAVFCFVLMRRSLIMPIKRLTESTNLLAHGDLEIQVPSIARGDEIGGLARSIDVFRTAMFDKRDADERERAQQESSLARQVHLDLEIDRFRQSVEVILSVVGSHADRTRAYAKDLSDVTSGAETETAGAAASSSKISSHAIQVASATEELAASVAEIARQTNTAFAKVDAMSEAASRTDAIVKTLSEAAQRIGAVVGMIKTVADQTNLLSLNATIEAARAGESGKGFAVVAQEVKLLSSQTMGSAEEISKLVMDMQEQTKDAVRSIEEMTILASDAQCSTAAISAAVNQQQVVSSEIASAINETSRGSAELTRVINSVSSIVGKTSLSANQALGTADDLAQKTIHLKQSVDEFLEKVKAA